MLSSTPMTDDIEVKPAVALSEDVQDVLHYAKKAALRQKSTHLQDRHLLLGLFKTNRLFTRLDALLKQAGAPAKTLSRLYRQEEALYPPPNGYTMLLEQAQDLALAERPPGEKPQVEIEHLLLALTQSTDALVQAVLSKANLTRQGLLDAIPQVEEQSPLRIVLYCLRETLEVVFVVLFLVIVIKQGLGEFRLIPSESMVPTLQIGDRIVVEKVSHWYRKPQRGDILVFYPPEPEALLKNDPWSLFLRLTGFSGIIYDRESKIDTAFIKRVVALPGDIVEVRPVDGVYINNQKLPEPYTAEVANTCTFVNYCGPVKVPRGMYYMMGDNRNHSADSRYWQFLPEDRIIGRAVFRFFPLDERLGKIGH